MKKQYSLFEYTDALIKQASVPGTSSMQKKALYKETIKAALTFRKQAAPNLTGTIDQVLGEASSRLNQTSADKQMQQHEQMRKAYEGAGGDVNVLPADPAKSMAVMSKFVNNPNSNKIVQSGIGAATATYNQKREENPQAPQRTLITDTFKALAGNKEIANFVEGAARSSGVPQGQIDAAKKKLTPQPVQGTAVNPNWKPDITPLPR